MHELLIETIENSFKKWYDYESMVCNADPQWVLVPPSRTHCFSNEEEFFLGKVRKSLAELIMVNHNEVQVCVKALLERGYGCAKKLT